MSKRRSQRNTPTSGDSTPQAGKYSISTGEVELRRDPYSPDGWEVYVNGVPSSHIDADPTVLSYEYMRWIAAAATDFLEHNPPPYDLRITHLGGGACSLARWFVHRYPNSKNTVVEIDAELARLVREWFELPRAPRLKIRAADARAVAGDFLPASRDLIIRDVFAGDRTPANVCTKEFIQDCARGLGETGLYIANCGDHRDLRHARNEMATLRGVFPHSAAIADPAMLKGRRYGNILLLGSMRPLPAHPSLERILRSDAIPANYCGDQWCEKFARAGTAYTEKT